MADVTLTYKGATIAELSDSGSKTLRTAGKFCEADIGVAYVKPEGEGANPFYLSQYITAGDTTVANFLNSINYSVHSNTCLVIIRSNGTTAPETGSYTINNFIAGFKNGTLVNGSDMYVTKKVAPNTMATFPQFNEKSDKFYLDNGVLKTNYNGTSCLASAGAAITLAEIDLPDNFWDVLTAEEVIS